MTNLTAIQISELNRINETTRSTELGNRIDLLTIKAGTPVNAVAATKTLTINGVVIDGETVTIDNPAVNGSDVYEFLADTAQTKTVATNKSVNIMASTTKASVTLTVDTQPTAGNTMTIGTKVYTFVAVGADDSDGKISVGADLAAAKVNIVAAINGTAGFDTAHPLVSAADFVTNSCVITALVGGTAGNAIAATETFTAASNVFGSATLISGTDCSAANAITALVSAITALDTQGVGAADGAGDTVVLTADVAGVVGNAIIIGETLANGSFTAGATVLSGGVNGTVGAMMESKVDASYLYRCIADNTISGANWRRISLGSVY